MVAQLWSEHLNLPVAEAERLLANPEEAFNFFKEQAIRNPGSSLSVLITKTLFNRVEAPPPTKSGQVAPGSGILLLRYDWGFGSFIRTSGAGVGVRDEIREQLSLIGDRACHAKRSEFPDSSRAGILCRAMGCKEKR